MPKYNTQEIYYTWGCMQVVKKNDKQERLLLITKVEHYTLYRM